MLRPVLSKRERQVRLNNYLRRHPDDRLMRYLVMHHEVITRIYRKTGNLHLVLPPILQSGILDSHGNQVTLAVLRYAWYRLNRVLERIEKFDKVTQYAASAKPKEPKTD